ncbi:MAG TPA: hypothetical protein VFK39_02945 [Gemmatimonadaceae bacterium]|nr:hypothetical protein [Gemmatimonadaceae bacterium]
MKLSALTILLALVAAPAAAQVGHRPSESPYHDIPFKQEITLFGGTYQGAIGKAGVGPTGGPVIGARYSIRLGGPVEAVAHVARVATSRMVKDPTKVDEERRLGEQSFGLYMADVGFALNLTGQKSYHRFVPVVGAGLGVVSGSNTPDVGGFKVGTPFALNFRAAIRFVPEGNISARLELSDNMFQLSYPSSYFRSPVIGSGTPILSTTAGDNQWTHHRVLTLGISYMFSR